MHIFPPESQEILNICVNNEPLSIGIKYTNKKCEQLNLKIIGKKITMFFNFSIELSTIEIWNKNRQKRIHIS